MVRTTVECAVVSPFDIEEIFPEGSGAVRLPRRQTGSSPQGLAVTLLADYTLRARAWLPSSAIVALLAESDVSPAGARTVISRLFRRGVLEGSRQGRRSSYRLTKGAAINLSAGGREIVRPAPDADSWDRSWTLVAFSLPAQDSTRRRSLRGQLRWNGFAPLYDGLWISPHALSAAVRRELAQLTRGAFTVFRATPVETELIISRNPLDAWDIAAIAGQYESFVEHWSPVLRRIHAGSVRGAEAVRMRTEVMDLYRRFSILDPQLPVQLLPPGWPRDRARDVFAGVYDGLAGPAEEHVRAVARRFADGAQPSVSAHTTAELLAGVQPDSN